MRAQKQNQLFVFRHNTARDVGTFYLATANKKKWKKNWYLGTWFPSFVYLSTHENWNDKYTVMPEWPYNTHLSVYSAQYTFSFFFEFFLYVQTYTRRYKWASDERTPRQNAKWWSSDSLVFWVLVRGFLGFGLGLLEKLQFLAKMQKQLPLFGFATCNYRYQKMLDQKKNEKKITQMRVHTCTIITFGFCCATTVWVCVVSTVVSP